MGEFMRYLDIERIYKHYKKNTSPLYLYWRYNRIQFIIFIILSLVWIFKINTNDKIIFWISYLSSIIFGISLVISNDIKLKKELNIKFYFSTDVMEIHKRYILFKYIKDKYNITEENKKKLLIEVFKEKSKEYKKENILSLGIVGVILSNLFKEYIMKLINPMVANFIFSYKIIIIGIFLLVLIHIVRLNLLKIINTKSKIYYELYIILQEDLIFDFNNFMGELIQSDKTRLQRRIKKRSILEVLSIKNIKHYLKE